MPVTEEWLQVSGSTAGHTGNIPTAPHIRTPTPAPAPSQLQRKVPGALVSPLSPPQAADTAPPHTGDLARDPGTPAAAVTRHGLSQLRGPVGPSSSYLPVWRGGGGSQTQHALIFNVIWGRSRSRTGFKDTVP